MSTPPPTCPPTRPPAHPPPAHSHLPCFGEINSDVRSKRQIVVLGVLSRLELQQHVRACHPSRMEPQLMCFRHGKRDAFVLEIVPPNQHRWTSGRAPKLQQPGGQNSLLSRSSSSSSTTTTLPCLLTTIGTPALDSFRSRLFRRASLAAIFPAAFSRTGAGRPAGLDLLYVKCGREFPRGFRAHQEPQLLHNASQDGQLFAGERRLRVTAAELLADLPIFPRSVRWMVRTIYGEVGMGRG